MLKDDVCSEEEMNDILCVKRSNTECEFCKFVIEWGHEGRNIAGVIRDDTDADEIRQVGPDLRREIVDLENDRHRRGPTSSTSKHAVSISADRECDVILPTEILVRALFTIDLDMLLQQGTVVVGVEDISNVSLGGLVAVTIGQFLDHFSALEEGLKAWNEWKVVIDLPWLAIGRKARLLADRTAEAAPIFLGVCDTRFDAAIIFDRLDAGKDGDSMEDSPL